MVVRSPITRGEPRKRRKPKPKLQHWKILVRLATNDTRWQDMYHFGVDETGVIEDFLFFNPDRSKTDIERVILIG